MRVHERYVNFYFQQRNESDFECFSNRSKIFILHDSKLIDRRFNVFDFLESVSNNELVDNRRSNHRRVDLFNSDEDCVSCRD
jgi:hypothetical protein